jgi:membrane-associated phospholipid phosphatase
MPAVTEARVRRVAVAWAVILAAVLALLTAAVDRRNLQFSDRLLLLIAQAPAGRPLDIVMALFSLTGAVEVTGLAMLALVLSARSQAPLGWERWVPLVVFVVVTLVEVAGKDLVHQPAPPPEFLRVRLPGFGLSTAGSFPSGHMVRVTLVMGLLALRAARRTRRLLWLWLCVAAVWTVGYSRVYLGHHWPADAAGGILLGGIGLALCLAIAPRGSVGDVEPPSGTPSHAV